MYLSTESIILPPGTKTFNTKWVFSSVLESEAAEDIELQDSVAANGSIILD